MEGTMLGMTIQNLGDVTVLHCHGPLTLGSRTDLVSTVLAQPSARTIVLDFAGVSKLDAAGIGVLVDLRNHLSANARRLKLMNVNPRIEHVLQLTGVSTVLEVCSLREMMTLICRASAKPYAHGSLPIPGPAPYSPEAA